MGVGHVGEGRKEPRMAPGFGLSEWGWRRLLLEESSWMAGQWRGWWSKHLLDEWMDAFPWPSRGALLSRFQIWPASHMEAEESYRLEV